MITSSPWFVFPTGGHHQPRVVAEVQQLEDAYLIAAAPELLAAAKRALEWYEPRLAPGEDRSVCNQLRDAINKAEVADQRGENT